MATVQITGNDNVGAIVELLDIEPQLCVVDGSQLTVPVDQSQLDAAFASYNADRETYQLTPLRNQREMELSTKVAEFIESRYPAFRLQLFNGLYTYAVRHGLDNRANYIEQLLDWVGSATAVALIAKSALAGATTADGIQLVNVSLDSLAATDPHVTIEQAIGIND